MRPILVAACQLWLTLAFALIAALVIGFAIRNAQAHPTQPHPTSSAPTVTFTLARAPFRLGRLPLCLGGCLCPSPTGTT
jgi:hypothetical protein